MELERRSLLTVAALAPLAGCATAPRYSLYDGVQRLLTLSTDRAFQRLFAPNGFYDSGVARIQAPAALGARGGKWAAALQAALQTDAFRRRASYALSNIAQDAARRATPIVMQAIRSLPPREAEERLNATPTAATDLLKQRAGPAVVDALLPGVSRGLRSDLAEMAGAALAASTGIDYVELGQTIASQAMDGIFAAIGREEAAIRADPAATRDPVLIALLPRPRR